MRDVELFRVVNRFIITKMLLDLYPYGYSYNYLYSYAESNKRFSNF